MSEYEKAIEQVRKLREFEAEQAKAEQASFDRLFLGALGLQAFFLVWQAIAIGLRLFL